MKTLRHRLLYTIPQAALVMLLTTEHVFSEPAPGGINTSRYVNIEVGATPAQINPLLAVIEMEFPDSVNTVGQALIFLANAHGYVLDLNAKENPEQYVLLNLPLQNSFRHLGPMTLSQALDVMGGEAFAANINPVTRSISYRLKNDYCEFVTKKQVEEARTHWLKQSTVINLAMGVHDDDAAKANTNRKFYGPIQKDETLSAIALALNRPGLTLNQKLVLLFRKNPHAFGGANLNQLLIGTTLHIPKVDEGEPISISEANAVVKEHNLNWLRGRESP